MPTFLFLLWEHFKIFESLTFFFFLLNGNKPQFCCNVDLYFRYGMQKKWREWLFAVALLAFVIAKKPLTLQEPRFFFLLLPNTLRKWIVSPRKSGCCMMVGENRKNPGTHVFPWLLVSVLQAFKVCAIVLTVPFCHTCRLFSLFSLSLYSESLPLFSVSCLWVWSLSSVLPNGRKKPCLDMLNIWKFEV